MKFVVDRAIPFLEGLLESFAEVEYLSGGAFTPSAIADADALIIRTRTRCNKALLAGSNVRLIATATIGFDHIDTQYCLRHDIRIATAAGCNARGVLQWVGAALAFLAHTQGWQPQQRTLGIVGVGHVGELVREYALAWGFRVVCCDPPRQAREGGDFLPLNEVVAQADILTLHTPLDNTTRHLINTERLKLLRPNALIINTSRGEVIDTEALLQSEHMTLLDVWEHEPSINPSLLDRALIATPHIAGYSAQGKANATAIAVAALCDTFPLPLQGWFPPQIAPSVARAITWQELCDTIGQYVNLEAESLRLKNHIADFEHLRDNYTYREEYF